MAKFDPAIRHAISPPEFGEDKIHRESLVDRLHGEIPRKLIAIAAPAGYGKTTILSDFTKHTDLPIVWIQVSAADRDLMRLVSVLVAALETRFRRIRDEFDIPSFAGSSSHSLAKAISDLIEENIPENFIIVFDDVHLLHSSSSSMAFIDHFLELLPEQVTIIAAGREVLEVSLARLMANGELAGFGPHDLALTWDETFELIQKINGNEPTSQSISRIQEYTQGWVTGVVLSEFGAVQASLEAGVSEPLVYEYLSSVVLNRMRDELRRFVLDASVIPVMTAELCNSVLEIDNSESMLRELVNRNIFITESGTEESTFEFHPLFRTHLIDVLKASSPDRAKKLQIRAAETIKLDAPEVATDLYLEMGDLAAAGELAEGQAREYFLLDRYETIKKWFDEISDAPKLTPLLSYYYAVMEANRGATQRAIEILDEVIDQEPRVDVLCLALIDKADYLLRVGDTSSPVKILSRVQPLLDEIDDPTIIAHSIRLEAKCKFEIENLQFEAGEKLDSALAILNNSEHQQLVLKILQDQSLYFGTSGDWNRARKSITKSLDIATEIAPPMGQIPSYINISHIEYLEGKFQEALQNLEIARGLAARAGSPRLEAQVLLAQGDIFNDVGLVMQAGSLYESALNAASPVEDIPLLSYGSLCASVLHRRSGSISLANEWLRRATNLRDGDENFALLNQKAALISYANPNEAIRILSGSTYENLDLLSAQDRAQRDFALVKAHYHAGNLQEARTIFSNCLEEASIRSAFQFIAAELFADDELADWVFDDLDDVPLIQTLKSQYQMIEVFHSHYSSDEQEQQKAGLIAKGLGKARLIWDGEEVGDLKPQAVEIFYMLIDERYVERDRIIEEFWPDHPPGRQTANLHMAVYSIRRLLGKENILLNGTTYSLSDSIHINYDVSEFERATSVFHSLPPGDPRSYFALTEAVNLYDGHFLPEFYSDWVEKRRRELELSYLDIASHYADESIMRKQPSRALSTLRNALRIDPYRDDLNQLYLQALLDLGRRSEVVTHYRNYKQLLHDDLGLDPAKQVTQIHDKALRTS